MVRDASGAPLCTVLFANDVSGLKRAVRSSEQRFRRMVEMSSDWYWVQDEQFHFVEVPGLDHQGDDTDIVLGKARWEIPGLAPLPEKVWEQHRAKLARHESFSDFMFLRHNKSGELRYLSVSGEPLFDEQGRFRGYHGIGKDITDRARDQKALEDSEERYRMLFDVQPQPMWVVDAKTLAFLAVNGAAMRLYGYSKEEFLAMTADQIRPEEDIEDLRKAFEDRSRNYRQRVWRHRKKSGELIQVKVISFNLDFDGHAGPAGRDPRHDRAAERRGARPRDRGALSCPAARAARHVEQALRIAMTARIRPPNASPAHPQIAHQGLRRRSAHRREGPHDPASRPGRYRRRLPPRRPRLAGGHSGARRAGRRGAPGFHPGQG